MGDYTVILNVGKTLVSLLWNNIKDDSQVNSLITSEDQISLSSPEQMESDGSKKLSLFLYHITEFSYLRNQEMPIKDPAKLRGPPLYLTLHYLITPYTQNRESDHILLGKVMQVFLDNAILRGSILQGTLAENGEELRVIMDSLSIDELNKIWAILDKPYKLSVSYTVTPVRIESTREREVTRVVEKEAKYSVVSDPPELR